MANPSLYDAYNAYQQFGVQLQHQFRLYLTNVDAYFPDTGATGLTMYAQGATLPTVTQNTTTLTYLAYPFKVPSNFTMTQELDITVNCDQNHLLRTGFMRWLNEYSQFNIVNGGSGGGLKRPTPPSRNIIIETLDQTLTQVTSQFVLVGAFPVDVGTMAVDNTKAEIATFTLKLAYQYWENENTRALPVSQG